MALAFPRRNPRSDAATRHAGIAVLALAALTALLLATLHHPLIARHPVASGSGAPSFFAVPAPAQPTGAALTAAPLSADGIDARTAVPPAGLHVGTATFYAGDFQGQTMADGRTFDMNDPTIAASNTWPLGTRLRLRRAPNSPWDATLSRQERAQYQRQAIVVTVSDHGDFDHALDLSRAAFARLGRTDEGVIHVLIEPLDAPGAAAASVAR